MIKRIFWIGVAVATVGLVGPVPSPVLRAQGGCSPATVMSPGGSGVALEETSLSGDGRYLAFSSSAPDLVPGDTNGALDVFVFDRATCATERISVTSDEAQANAGSIFPSISRDGRFVAFLSAATNLGPSPDPNGAPDVFVRDRLNGTTQLVSAALAGGWGNNTSSESGPVAISGNGQFVAFWSNASDLVNPDTNGQTDLFVRDLAGGSTTRVSVATGGVQATGSELVNQVTMTPAFSDDGRYVGFSSTKADLVSGDSNGLSDVFRHDRQTGVTVRLSVASDGNWRLPLSARDVAGRQSGRIQHSLADRPFPTTPMGSLTPTCAMSCPARRRAYPSSAMGEKATGNRSCRRLSGDGRYVAFISSGTNLVVGDNADFFDVYVHDRTTGITPGSSASAGGVPANGDSFAPRLSDDGAFVSFPSIANNLGALNAQAGTRNDFVTRWRSVAAQPDINLLPQRRFCRRVRALDPVRAAGAG